MLVLFSKFILALFGALMHYPIIKNYKNFNIVYIFIGAFLFRWLLLSVWFLLMDGSGSGDVVSYEVQIKWILDGLVPNRDFVSPYGFYFFYLLSIPYQFFDHPASIMLILHLFEFFGVMLFYFSIKKLMSINKAKLFALLYFFNPLVILWFAFDGQDESLLIFGFGGLFFASTVIPSKFLKAFFSGFSIFVAKITALAAVVPLFLKINTKEKIIFLLIISTFLLPPLFLNSQIFGFQFELEASFNDLTKTVYPGNIWFLVNQLFSTIDGEIITAKNYGSVNSIIIFLSRCTLLMLSIFTTILLFRFRKKINEVNFLAIGTVLYTISYQLSSYYTSPGFMAVIVPFLIYFLLHKYELEKLPIFFFTTYFLIISFDINIYLRTIITEHFDGNVVIFFNIYEACIIFANIFVYVFIIKYLLDKNLNKIQN